MDDPELTELLREHASRNAVPSAALGLLCDGEVSTAYCGVGRALYRSLFQELMKTRSGIGMQPLELRPLAGAAGNLSRFAAVYGWPDRRLEVTATGTGLVLTTSQGSIEAVPIDDRTFLVDVTDPDTPTVTFGGFDDNVRPRRAVRDAVGPAACYRRFLIGQPARHVSRRPAIHAEGFARCNCDIRRTTFAMCSILGAWGGDWTGYPQCRLIQQTGSISHGEDREDDGRACRRA